MANNARQGMMADRHIPLWINRKKLGPKMDKICNIFCQKCPNHLKFRSEVFLSKLTDFCLKFINFSFFFTFRWSPTLNAKCLKWSKNWSNVPWVPAIKLGITFGYCPFLPFYGTPTSLKWQSFCIICLLQTNFLIPTSYHTLHIS